MESIREWSRSGYITVTKGRTTDYRVIKTDILRYVESYQVPIIFYDRYNANELVSDLIDEGVNMQPMAQTAHHLNVPTQELQKSVLEGRYQHGNNPVTRWMMRNVRIIEDQNKSIKVSKNRSKGQVDGVVASIMAIGGELDGGRETDIPGFAVFNYK
jgi:phage terminase large subunit-like protein